MIPNINRRQLLKAASIGSTEFIIATGLAQPSSNNLGSVRLLEIGLYYDLNGDHEYFKIHIDSINPFWTDRVTNQIFVKQRFSGRIPEKVEANDVLVGTDSLRKLPVQITGSDPVHGLPTELRLGRVPSESIVLEEPHNAPAIAVHLQGQVPVVDIDGHEVRTTPGMDKEVELEPTPVVTQTEVVTDEIVEIDWAPEEEWGPKIEFGSVETDATPIVTITDYGELPVVSLN